MPTGTRSLRLALALLLAGATFPAAARAGAWTTYLRAKTYQDLVARHDTIWCASSDGGLLRYLRAADRFESIPREPGRLASQALEALEFDRSGRLWVGSLDHGVSRLSADGERWDLISELDGLPRGAITVLRAVGDTMLVGTDHGVALWNGSEVAGTVPEGVNPSPFASDVVTGVVLSGDSLWVATRKGLYVSRASTGLSSWTLADTGFANQALLGLAWDGHTLMTVAGDVPRVFVAGSGTWVARGGIGAVLALSDDRSVILASSDQGVFRWAGADWVSLPDAPFSSTCAVDDPGCHGIVVTTSDETGRVWGANRDGLRDGVGAAGTLHEPDAPVGNNVQNILLQGARVYIGTYFEGVGRFDGARWRNWFVSDCVSGCDTTFYFSAYAFSMLVDKQGRKWVGNWSSAIESFDDDVSPPQFTHYWPRPPAPAPFVEERHTFGWSADYDESGGRWFGLSTNFNTDDPPIGIDYYDPDGAYRANYRQQNTPAMPADLVRALIVDRARGTLWTGYPSKGVVVFRLPDVPGDPLRLVAAPTAINTLDIFGLAAHQDSIWVMSTADLRRFSATTQKQIGATITLVGSPAPRGACHPLDVGPDGRVWVGTDAGVHVYGPGGSVVEYNEVNSPIAGDEVRAIRVDPVTGVAWIGTATGLSRFDPAYVAPAVPVPSTLEVRAYPNPVWLTGAGLSLRLAGNATAYRGAVYDAGGRKLHGFEGKNGQVFWDGRDASGRLVHPGVYFVRVEANGRARTLRVALLR